MHQQSRSARAFSRRTLLSTTLIAATALAGSALILEGRDAQAQGVDRSPQIKAACIYNFVKFVDWPDRVLPANNTLVIGVLGQSPVGSALTGLNGKSAKNRTLVVRQLSSPGEVRNCQVVFVSPSELGRLGQFVEAAHDASVLTVGDSDGFARAGGVINFIEQGNRVRFEINSAAAEKSKLTISSQLLRLAKITGG